MKCALCPDEVCPASGSLGTRHVQRLWQRRVLDSRLLPCSNCSYGRTDQDLLLDWTDEATHHKIDANTAMPIPTGAMYVALCFSVANMKTANTTCAVANISMNSPWLTVV